MSILLFGAGGLAFLAGIAMVGYGIPINEFSFGNTLIISGTVAIIGGMIVIGLGIAVSYLRRVVEAVATMQAARADGAFEGYEQPAAAAPPRVPFPTKSKSESKAGGRADARLDPRYEPDQSQREPAGYEPMPSSGAPFAEAGRDFYAPSLPNPDEPPVTVDDEVSLSPRHPMAPSFDFAEPRRAPPPGPAFSIDPSELDELRDQRPKRDPGRRAAAPPPRIPPLPRTMPAERPAPPEPAGQADWSPPVDRPPASERAEQPMPPAPSLPPGRSPQDPYFESKWAAEPPAAEPRPAAPQWDPPQTQADNPMEPAFDERHPDDAEPDDEPRSVAILKSGVVDGMGYTLYVDGSIEAELPQGTLRFASITDLRQHLEKTS